MEHRCLLRVPLPREKGIAHLLVARGQPGVRGDHPREAIGVLGHQSQPDEAAPVLPDEGEVAQVELVEQGRAHPLDVPGIGVVVLRVGLVGATEADEVGGDGAEARVDEQRDHLAVEVAPRRLAVHEQDGGSVGPALVEVVDAEPPAFTVVDLHVVRGEGKVGQRGEARVGCAECVHDCSSSRAVSMRVSTRRAALTERP